MEYQQFISTITKHQTDRVRAINIPESSCPSPIPESFQIILPEVVKIVEKNFYELSDGKKHIALFGFQPTAISIQSNIPIAEKRIFSKKQLQSHLSCTIYYLTVEHLSEIKNWAGYKTIVIDLTSGIVMNGKYYICLTGHYVSGGKIYGRISQKKINAAWKKF